MSRGRELWHQVLNVLVLAAIIWIAFTWGTIHWIDFARAHQIELLVGAVVLVVLYRL